MSAGPLDLYVAASVGRWRDMCGPAARVIDRPGLHGLLGGEHDPGLRLLVTDDRAYPALVALRDGARPAVITVFEGAPRCRALLTGDPAWAGGSSTAMACRDLAVVPRLALPDALTLRAIRRVEADPPDGVALLDATAAVVKADPGEDRDTLAAFLGSLPHTTRLFAAVDADGGVRATAGFQLAGAHARVILVDTDPAWRGRGIASAMTSEALHAARDDGAREATLDASGAARSLYRRLGFDSAGETTHFRAA